jgi:hypothetical protein
MARILTRLEFYDLVWSQPMTHLAKEFALSDAALHKICKKHHIPKPPMGWWTKKALGHALVTPPCPPAKPGTPERITIAAGVLAREPALVAEARERARIAASADGDAGEAIPRPVVVHTLAKLRKGKPLGLGTVSANGAGVVKAEVAPASIDRLGLVLNRLVAAAAAQGFELVAKDAAAHFSNGADTLDFSISEGADRVKHVATEEELAKQAAWQAKQDRYFKTDPWRAMSFDRPVIPEWDYRPSGRLSIEFERVYVWGGYSPRRSFRDAKVQRLEKMASDIAVGMAVLFAAKAAERERRAAEQARADEARRRRELEARAKHIEERRGAAVGAILSELHDLERLRVQLELLERQVEEAPTARVLAFLAWSREHLAAREARLLPSSLEARFEAEQLFGDTDDFGFRPNLYG